MALCLVILAIFYNLDDDEVPVMVTDRECLLILEYFCLSWYDYSLWRLHLSTHSNC